MVNEVKQKVVFYKINQTAYSHFWLSVITSASLSLMNLMFFGFFCQIEAKSDQVKHNIQIRLDSSL